jgi:ABC-type antimicrobial peptide transport system permease subunit
VVVREAARQVLIGLVFGVVGGTLATALMPDRTTPVSVPPVEATLFTALALVLTLVMAAVGPVWRVWREDFAGVLREEG